MTHSIVFDRAKYEGRTNEQLIEAIEIIIDRLDYFETLAFDRLEEIRKLNDRIAKLKSGVYKIITAEP